MRSMLSFDRWVERVRDSTMQDYLAKVRAFVRYLKPEFLDERSEICELEEV